MGKSKHKEHNVEAKDGEIGRLKRRIRHLEHENSRLKSELRTYDKAFDKTVRFMKEKTKNLSVEDLIKGAERELTLEAIKDDKTHRFEDLKAKWQCFKCQEGVLKLIVIPGNRYFRKCSMCDNRTEVQELHEDVEGIK